MVKTKNLISFVIPCYRSQATIKKVIDEIIEVVAQRAEYDYEIICVNDGSPDNVYAVLKVLAESNSKIKVINFAKNMGKHAAVLAGYAYVTGEYVVNLDDDEKEIREYKSKELRFKPRKRKDVRLSVSSSLPYPDDRWRLLQIISCLFLGLFP